MAHTEHQHNSLQLTYRRVCRLGSATSLKRQMLQQHPEGSAATVALNLWTVLYSTMLYCIACCSALHCVVLCCVVLCCVVLCCVVLCCVVLCCAEGAITKRQRPGCLPTGTGKRAGLCVLCARCV